MPTLREIQRVQQTMLAPLELKDIEDEVEAPTKEFEETLSHDSIERLLPYLPRPLLAYTLMIHLGKESRDAALVTRRMFKLKQVEFIMLTKTYHRLYRLFLKR